MPNTSACFQRLFPMWWWLLVSLLAFTEALRGAAPLRRERARPLRSAPPEPLESLAEALAFGTGARTSCSNLPDRFSCAVLALCHARVAPCSCCAKLVVCQARCVPRSSCAISSCAVLECHARVISCSSCAMLVLCHVLCQARLVPYSCAILVCHARLVRFMGYTRHSLSRALVSCHGRA